MTKTTDFASPVISLFESYVIQYMTKTKLLKRKRKKLFESYVILYMTKTVVIDSDRPDGLRVM